MVWSILLSARFPADIVGGTCGSGRGARVSASGIKPKTTARFRLPVRLQESTLGLGRSTVPRGGSLARAKANHAMLVRHCESPALILPSVAPTKVQGPLCGRTLSRED